MYGCDAGRNTPCLGQSIDIPWETKHQGHVEFDHITGLRASDAKTRMQSVRRAAQLGDAGAVPGLCSLLSELEDSNALTAVVKALGKIGDGSAIPALIAHFDKLEQSSLVNTLSDLGVFDSVLPIGGGAAGSKQRRKIRAALRNAESSALKQLLVGGSLDEEDIRRVIPEML